MTLPPMRIGSLFAGIGGLEKGLCDAGLGEVVWQVEKDGYCRAVLAKHWPDAERFDDVRTVGAATLAPVDLICGGFPCQDVSSAGKRVGLAGARSGLWFEFHRIVRELAPAWVVVENVASGARAWVDAVCSGLGELGYHCLPIPIAASDVGAPHERARIFIVAANAHSAVVRSESRRSERTLGEGPRVPANDGVTGDTASYAHEDGELAQPEHAEMAGPPDVANAHCRIGESRPGAHGRRISESVHGGWGETLPPVLRMASGISSRLDRTRLDKPTNRIRALGNSVVPQCAEVVGHVIQELRS